MDKGILTLLSEIDLLDEVPDHEPPAREVLSRRACPLHDGADNPHAFLVYKDGYACTTRGCHKSGEFGCNLFGLVRHLVFRVCGKVMPFKDAACYARTHKDELRALVPVVERYVGRRNSQWSRARYSVEGLAACLEIPDRYYLERGYRAETLVRFGVGTCVRPLPDGRNLHGWAVIPVYAGIHGRKGPTEIVGYTARNAKWEPGSRYPRWLHAVKRDEHLFNLGSAMLGTGPLVICEGPGDVMRFHEAGFTRAIAAFGASLTLKQEYQLWSPIGMSKKVYIAADADEAGRRFADELLKKLRPAHSTQEFAVIFPTGGVKDFGEMPSQQIRDMGL